MSPGKAAATLTGIFGAAAALAYLMVRRSAPAPGPGPDPGPTPTPTPTVSPPGVLSTWDELLLPPGSPTVIAQSGVRVPQDPGVTAIFPIVPSGFDNDVYAAFLGTAENFYGYNYGMGFISPVQLQVEVASWLRGRELTLTVAEANGWLAGHQQPLRVGYVI